MSVAVLVLWIRLRGIRNASRLTPHNTSLAGAWVRRSSTTARHRYLSRNASVTRNLCLLRLKGRNAFRRFSSSHSGRRMEFSVEKYSDENPVLLMRTGRPNVSANIAAPEVKKPIGQYRAVCTLEVQFCVRCGHMSEIVANASIGSDKTYQLSRIRVTARSPDDQ